MSTSCGCPGPGTGRYGWWSVRRPSFRLATLDGHLEAGQIEFRARDRRRLLEFRDRIVGPQRRPVLGPLYHHLRMAKEVQLHMWTSVSSA